MSDRKPSHLAHAVVAALVLLGIYVGTYYATVRPTWYSVGILPVYYAGPFVEGELVVFAPIHWLDRRIRPVWRGLIIETDSLDAPPSDP